MILELACAGSCRKPSRRLSDQCTKEKGQRGRETCLATLRTLRYASDGGQRYLTPRRNSGNKEIAAPHLRQASFRAGPL